MESPFLSPKAIVDRGEAIYNTNYRQQYEREHPGEFVVIEITSARAFLGQTPEGALKEAQAAIPKGFFHIIKIGEPGAFQVSHSTVTNADVDWLFS
jgi:hypothetical protein